MLRPMGVRGYAVLAGLPATALYPELHVYSKASPPSQFFDPEGVAHFQFILYLKFILQPKTNTAMAGTFSQIYIQLVFAVKGRESLIKNSWEEDLFRYISGIVQKEEQKMLAINGMPDHIHLLIGMRPTCCLSDLVREVKKSSAIYIREKRLSPFRFQWQEGYGSFSYSHSHLNNVISYIQNQKEHHKKKTFREEYMGLLKKFEVQFKNEYLFEWIDEQVSV